MLPISLNVLKDAATLVHSQMPPTPQYVWPQLCARVDATVWIKHENHTPTGAFKVRGGITFVDWLLREHSDTKGIITATRGNHGQSQARAAAAADLPCTIVVPHGNSLEKNAAMRSFGANVIEFGTDFDEARIEAARLAEKNGLFMVPPFHLAILRGVASYALELFAAVSELDTVYVPVGCGSGICAVIAARDALGLSTKVVGVVSTQAAGAKLSFEAGHLIETDSADTFADGVAVRIPVQEAFDIYSQGADRIMAVSDKEIAVAMRIYFKDTHNVAEGAGAASLAALLNDKDIVRGRTVAAILTGGNIDSDDFAAILGGREI
jgi:threonine dehydratase